MTGPKALYSRFQRKAISATVIIGGELPYSLYQVRYFAGYCLSALKTLSIRHSEKNRLGLEEDEVVWIRSLLYEISISKRHSCTEENLLKILQAYGFPPKIVNLIKMFYKCSSSTNVECSSNVVSSLETPLQKHFQ